MQPPDGRVTIWNPELRRPVPAARVVWEAMTGVPVPATMSIQHSCDNPWCVHGEHLLLGTATANSLSMSLRGRSTTGRGAGRERGGVSRLPFEQQIATEQAYVTAREIRAKHRRMMAARPVQTALFEFVDA